ncbi:MFS transporter [Micromonospora sediminicola]|uniref:MFS transporter n=1 Tax=Micromonospora sediminicola TaxID=946078 RepID=UPI0037AF73BB
MVQVPAAPGGGDELRLVTGAGTADRDAPVAAQVSHGAHSRPPARPRLGRGRRPPRDRRGLDEIGYGLLLTASAVGGLAGSALTTRLRSRFGTPALLRAGLLVEVGLQVVLGTTREPLVAGAALAVWGAHAVVWGVLVVSLRQRLVPDRLRGRVNGAYALADLGGAALGTLAGGLLAGLTAWAWPRLADTAAAGPPGPGGPPS